MLLFLPILFVIAVYFLLQIICLSFSKPKEDDELQLLTKDGVVDDYVVVTNSNAERVHNIEQLTVRFGKHEGKKWSEVPSKYLQWMVAEGHKYEQVAKILIAARKSDYTFH